jgi:hypothetical protein
MRFAEASRAEPSTSSVRLIPSGVSSKAHERHRKPDRDEDDHQSHNPIWNLEEGKNLRRDLNYQPADNCVRDGNLVDIPPFQLGEERTPFRHGVAGKFIFVTSVL